MIDLDAVREVAVAAGKVLMAFLAAYGLIQITAPGMIT